MRAVQPWLYPLCTTVSALFVRPDGPYQALVADCWDEARDARLYTGPNPVVAHPPCSVWSRLAPVNQARYGHEVGDDGGCFASALASVRRWGGVLEHPAGSLAWARHDLTRPTGMGWTPTGDGWVCEVAQSAYGHRAQKRTWLFYVGTPPPELDWRQPVGTAYVSFLSNHGGRDLPRLGKREASTSPWSFARMLVDLAREG